MSSSNSPVPESRMEEITEAACRAALANATSYVHDQAESWNTSIINTILEGLTSSTSDSAESSTQDRQYKYAVNSTIVQHMSEPTATSQTTQTLSPPSTPAPALALGANEADARDTETPVQGGVSDERSNQLTLASGGKEKSRPAAGRRGMHCATGAYWNNETDGMWTYKYEVEETKGLDVIVTIIWVSV